MKFVMAIKKHDSASAGRCAGHNLREHATASQLPKSAWLTRPGAHSVAAWQPGRLDAARALAKRKDAVVAIELVIQVGNQTDWRHPPTADHPHGKAQPGAADRIKALIEAVKQAAVMEFGASNVVGITAHSDESTPHVHLVVTPIKDGKLQAKTWTGGAAACAGLRQRIHEVINRRIECEYTKGAPGGDPHDPQKAAGATGGQKRVPGFIESVSSALSVPAALRAAHKRIAALELQIQTMFSAMKATERVAADRYNAMQAERGAKGELQQKFDQAQLEIKRQRAEIERLTAHEQAKPAEQAKPVNAPQSPVVAPSAPRKSGPSI